ncbi:hypothetical protein FTO39_11530, partial [Klebsiella pneumoniae]
FGLAENTYDLFVGKTLLHGDVLMWLMKTLLTSRCINQRGAGQDSNCCKVDYYQVILCQTLYLFFFQGFCNYRIHNMLISKT